MEQKDLFIVAAAGIGLYLFYNMTDKKKNKEQQQSVLDVVPAPKKKQIVNKNETALTVTKQVEENKNPQEYENTINPTEPPTKEPAKSKIEMLTPSPVETITVNGDII